MAELDPNPSTGSLGTGDDYFRLPMLGVLAEGHAHRFLGVSTALGLFLPGDAPDSTCLFQYFLPPSSPNLIPPVVIAAPPHLLPLSTRDVCSISPGLILLISSLNG